MSHHDCIGCPYATREEQEEIVTAVGGRLKIDRAMRQAVFDGEPIDLSPSQTHLLAAMARLPNRPVAKDRLILAIGASTGGTTSDQCLRLQVMQLRQRLAAYVKFFSIETAWGFGFGLFDAIAAREAGACP